MAEVRDGMDVERVREVARALTACGQRVDGVGDRGQQQMSLLGDVWSGEDLEEFADRWGDALPELRRAAQAVLDLARELLAQAGQQEEASGGEGGGGPRSPFAPGGPLNPFDRATPGPPVPPSGPRAPFNPFEAWGDDDGDEGWRPPWWRALEEADDYRRDELRIPFLVNAAREGLGEFVKGNVGPPRTWLKPMGPLSKALPFLGVLDAERDSMDVREDLARGQINPSEFWSKMGLGRGSAAAAFVPGVGTMISLGLSMEQFRADTKDEFDDKVSEKTGLHENVVKTIRLASSPGISLVTEVMPDRDFDLPRPSMPDIDMPDIDLPDRPKWLGG